MTDALDTLLPQPATLAVGGTTLTLTPMKFGQLAAALKLLGPLAGRLAAGSVDLFALLTDESERIIALVALLTGKPTAWVEALPPDEVVTLLSTLYAVNADFFARRVGPALTAALANVSAATIGRNPQTTPPTPTTEDTPSGPSSSAS